MREATRTSPVRARWPLERCLTLAPGSSAKDGAVSRRMCRPSSGRTPACSGSVRRRASSRAGRGPRTDSRCGQARRPGRRPGRDRRRGCTLLRRSRPRTCLMSVVLPAPLTPTRPKTLPRGTVRRTLSRAVLAPKRRVRPAVSMTASNSVGKATTCQSSSTGSSLSSRRRISSTTSPVRRRAGGPRRAGRRSRSVRILRRSRRARGEPAAGDIGAGGAALLDDSGDFELAVGAGDGVRVDHEVARRARGSAAAPRRAQPAGGDEVLHLVDDLQVDRHAVVRRDVDVHEPSLWRCMHPPIQRGRRGAEGISGKTAEDATLR